MRKLNADLWGVTERDKFGGYRQNDEKNLVDTDKMAKKIWWSCL